MVRRMRGMTSFSGVTIDPARFTADIAAGYVPFGQVRLTVGAFRYNWLGLDAGIELRTIGYFTEGLAHAKLQFVQAGPVAIAFDVAIGGGGGPTSRTDFVFEAGIPLTLLFGDLGALHRAPVPAGLQRSQLPDRRRLGGDPRCRAGLRASRARAARPRTARRTWIVARRHHGQHSGRRSAHALRRRALHAAGGAGDRGGGEREHLPHLRGRSRRRAAVAHLQVRVGVPRSPTRRSTAASASPSSSRQHRSRSRRRPVLARPLPVQPEHRGPARSAPLGEFRSTARGRIEHGVSVARTVGAQRGRARGAGRSAMRCRGAGRGPLRPRRTRGSGRPFAGRSRRPSTSAPRPPRRARARAVPPGSSRPDLDLPRRRERHRRAHRQAAARDVVHAQIERVARVGNPAAHGELEARVAPLLPGRLGRQLGVRWNRSRASRLLMVACPRSSTSTPAPAPPTPPALSMSTTRSPLLSTGVAVPASVRSMPDAGAKGAASVAAMGPSALAHGVVSAHEPDPVVTLHTRSSTAAQPILPLRDAGATIAATSDGIAGEPSPVDAHRQRQVGERLQPQRGPAEREAVRADGDRVAVVAEGEVLGVDDRLAERYQIIGHRQAGADRELGRRQRVLGAVGRRAGRRHRQLRGDRRRRGDGRRDRPRSPAAPWPAPSPARSAAPAAARRATSSPRSGGSRRPAADRGRPRCPWRRAAPAPRRTGSRRRASARCRPASRTPPAPAPASRSSCSCRPATVPRRPAAAAPPTPSPAAPARRRCRRSRSRAAGRSRLSARPTSA